MYKTILFCFLFISIKLSAQNYEPFFDSTTNLYGFRSCQEIEPVYEKVYEINYNTFEVVKNNKVGLMNKSGEIILPINFGWMIPHYGSSNLLLFNSDTLFFWDTDENILLDDTLILIKGPYDLLIDGGGSYIGNSETFQVYDNGSMSLANISQGIVKNMNTAYLDELNFKFKGQENTIYIAGNDSKYKFYDRKDQLISNESFNDFYGIIDEYAIVLYNSKVQFLNLTNGKLVSVSKKYKGDTYRNLSGKMGSISEKGEIGIPFIYPRIIDYRNGFHLAIDDDYNILGLYDLNGAQYLNDEDLKYNWSLQTLCGGDFFNGFHVVDDVENENYAKAIYLYNKESKKLEKVTDFIFSYISCYIDKDGTRKVESLDGKVGKIDKKCNVKWNNP